MMSNESLKVTLVNDLMISGILSLSDVQSPLCYLFDPLTKRACAILEFETKAHEGDLQELDLVPDGKHKSSLDPINLDEFPVDELLIDDGN